MRCNAKEAVIAAAIASDENAADRRHGVAQ
jgi:hypothetical protein